MHLADALDQLAEVRRRVTLAATFRGVRASTTFATAGVALMTAAAQSAWIGDGRHGPLRFVALWSVCAAASLAIIFVGAAMRVRRMASPAENSLAMNALETFAPTLVIGALVTLAAVWVRPELIPSLPAWWMILTSISIFAMRRLVNRAVVIPAAFFGLSGLAALVLDRPMHPLVMGSVFAIGQTLAAIVLRLTVERGHGA